MHLYREETLWRRLGKQATVLLIPLAILVFLLAMSYLERSTQQEALQRTRQAIVNAAVNCHAIEGFYPPNVEYLAENYGVQIDSSKFVVEYSVLGDNTLPCVNVVLRGTSSGVEEHGDGN